VPTPTEQTRASILSFDSIGKVLNFVCKCVIPCPIRAVLTQLYVYTLRGSLQQHSLRDGSRLRFLTDIVRPMCSTQAFMHPATFSKGHRLGPGQRAKLINLELNHTDVCAEVFALATGSSHYLLRTACEQAKDIPRASAIEEGFVRH
jgi:hypothetical protein